MEVISSAIFPSPNRICKMSDKRMLNYIHLHSLTTPYTHLSDSECPHRMAYVRLAWAATSGADVLSATRFRPACFDSYIAASAASTSALGVGVSAE